MFRFRPKYRIFEEHFSVHFGSPSQNVLKNDLQKSQIFFPFSAKRTNFGPKSDIALFIIKIRQIGKRFYFIIIDSIRLFLLKSTTVAFLQTAAEVQTAVNKVRYRGGETYTHKALGFASRVVFSKQHGGRGGRTKEGGVSQVLVVLTDGKSMNGKKTLRRAETLKSEGESLDDCSV